MGRRILAGMLAAALLPVLPAAADSRSELLAQRREQLREKYEARFRAADADQSRGLSREEIVAGGLPRRWLSHFAEIDADGDQALSPEELWAAWEQRMAQQQPRAGAPHR